MISRKTWIAGVLSAATALGIAFAPSIANATCQGDAFGYDVTASGSTVTVCVHGFPLAWGAPYGCKYQGPPQPMVRQDVATGAVVALPDFCADPNGPMLRCWVDECVPPGEYRYGLEWLPECCPSCTETRNYATITVGGGDAGDAGSMIDGGASCTRSATNPGPGPEDAAAVAWTDGAVLCGPGPQCVQTPQPDASSPSPDASTGATPPSSTSSGSCSVDALGAGAAGGGSALFIAIASALGLRARRLRRP